MESFAELFNKYGISEADAKSLLRPVVALERLVERVGQSDDWKLRLGGTVQSCKEVLTDCVGEEAEA